MERSGLLIRIFLVRLAYNHKNRTNSSKQRRIIFILLFATLVHHPTHPARSGKSIASWAGCVTFQNERSSFALRWNVLTSSLTSAISLHCSDYEQYGNRTGEEKEEGGRGWEAKVVRSSLRNLARET